MYREANASFLSSLFGNDALAQVSPINNAQSNSQTNSLNNTSPNPVSSKIIATDPDSNSQTMGLLQARVSSASVLQSQEEKGDTKDNSVDANASVKIVSDTSLLPATGPMGVSDGTKNDTEYSSDNQTSVYVVRSGDSLPAIAKMFGVSVNTILWANNMKKGDKLTEGDVLFILPVSGLEHTVGKGQTLESIAKLYKADVNDIIQYNDINLDTVLAAGDKLLIPNGSKSEENDKPIKNLAASTAKDKKYYDSHPTKALSGYYIDPVPGYRKSQGIHANNGVDLAIATGTPIHAAASGRVILAREEYNGGFGYLVVISHPNGTETLYAHQSKVIAQTGQEVSQGEIIGYVGSTGHSTGPHLHFEVHGARNPGADGSWAH